MGMGVTGRTLGVIGLGNIGREVFAAGRAVRDALPGPRSLRRRPAGGRRPASSWSTWRRCCARRTSSAICCALTAETRHLIDAARLALMKPTAYLINVARGPIVDQAALTDGAAASGGSPGPGWTSSSRSRSTPSDPILQLDNVILAPHALCWTDECFLGNGCSACGASSTSPPAACPRHVVNRERAWQHRALREKLTG